MKTEQHTTRLIDCIVATLPPSASCALRPSRVSRAIAVNTSATSGPPVAKGARLHDLLALAGQQHPVLEPVGNA